MDSANKGASKNQTSPYSGYNPWNLLFNPRKRSESESSVGSNTSTSSINSANSQTSSQFSQLQRQSNKRDEDYPWIMWHS